MDEFNNNTSTLLGLHNISLRDVGHSSSMVIIDSLITDYQFALIMAAYSALGIFVSSFGLVTNAINIKTFISMGVDGGLNLSFLFLSCSEFVCFLAALGYEMAMAFWVTEIVTNYKIWFDIHPYAINNFFGNVRNCLFEIPVLITTYLSVAKCMCVVRPLHFKNMFSISKTFWVMIGISVFAIGSDVPVLANMGVTRQFDKQINKTRPMLWLSPHRDIIKNIVWLSRDSIPAILSQAIIIVCVVVMSNTLRKSAKFRETSSSIRVTDRENGLDSRKGRKSADVRSNKDLQVIKQVVVLSVVYILGNTPKIVVFTALQLVPDLTLGRRYQNVYIVIMNARELSEMIMSAVNLLIYYKYNSKFRRHCQLNFFASK
ncbi:unnamed protein product [Lymnaea stagnalis]|uniref:G-protein coupled receptors family 1 profile domain-containing protein n=1 Tax=Lymnaea stagnalis TaxID=6523 RepID=A0AAV2IHA8_LYMST